MSACATHPERESAAACSGCRRPFCEACLVKFEKLSLCASCKAKYLEGIEERPARVAPARMRPPAERAPTLFWIGGAGALVFAALFAFVVIAGLAAPFSQWREGRRYAEAVDVLVSIGAALERHRADSGKFPERLADLVPSYLPRLPDDPYGDGAPRYEVVDDRRQLWSWGPDEEDDGGEPDEDLVYVVDLPR